MNVGWMFVHLALWLGFSVLALGGISLVAALAWCVCNQVLEAGRVVLLTRDFWDYRRDKSSAKPAARQVPGTTT